MGSQQRKTPGISYDEDDTAEVTSELQVTLGHLLTVGNDDGAPLASYSIRSAVVEIAR